MKRFELFSPDDMVEVLDDFYLLFLNKYDDVLVLIMKALILGLGCSFEIEKKLSQPSVTFDYTSSLFKHFMIILCKLFGSSFHITLPDGGKCIFSMPGEPPKVKIGSLDPILLSISKDDILSINYTSEFFKKRGFHIDLSALNPSHNPKSTFMTRQSVLPKRDEASDSNEKVDKKNEKENKEYFTTKLEDNYISNDNIYNPYMAYENEISSKRNSVTHGPQTTLQGPGLAANGAQNTGFQNLQTHTLVNLSDFYQNQEDEPAVQLDFKTISGAATHPQVTTTDQPLTDRSGRYTFSASNANQATSPLAVLYESHIAPGPEDGTGNIFMKSKPIDVDFESNFHNDDPMLKNGEASILYTHDLRQSIDFFKASNEQGCQSFNFGSESLMGPVPNVMPPNNLRHFYNDDNEPHIPEEYLGLGPSHLAIHSQPSFTGQSSSGITDSRNTGEQSLVDKIKLIINESAAHQDQHADSNQHLEEDGFNIKLTKPLDISIPVLENRISIGDNSPSPPPHKGMETIDESMNEDATLSLINQRSKQTSDLSTRVAPINLIASPVNDNSLPRKLSSDVKVEPISIRSQPEAQPSRPNPIQSQPVIQPFQSQSQQLLPQSLSGSILMQRINFQPGSKNDPTLSDKAKDPKYNKRPTASVELLNQINKTWLENHNAQKMDFGPLEDTGPQMRSREPSNKIKSTQVISNNSTILDQSNVPGPRTAGQSKIDTSQTDDGLTRKNQQIQINDTDRACRICSKPYKMTKMYYYDRAFFCGDCYATVSQRFKKINRCAGCKSEPERMMIMKFLLKNPFIKSEGSLMFTKEKKVDLFYTYINKYSSMIVRSNELQLTLKLISNNLVTPISTFAEIKVCPQCKNKLLKCSVCKCMLYRNEMMVVGKCGHGYCLDCLALLFLKKYTNKKEFTCKGHFCWNKTSLESVMYFLLDKLGSLDTESSLTGSKLTANT